MFASLQYLRAFSSIIVVYFHIFGIWGGSQGVAIFFVISGFIMLYLINEKHRSWKQFLLSRFLRVAPLYYLATILVLFLGIGYDPTFLRSIASFSFLSLGTVLPVGWTLTYEFIFYSVCTVSIAIGFLVDKKEYLVYAILIAIDLFLYIILRYKNHDYGHYFLIFIYGMLLYRIYNSRFFEIRNYLLVLLALLLSFLLISITDIKVNFFIEYGIMAFLLVGSLLYLEKHNVINKNIKLLLILGNASYSIYIIHWIVINTVSLPKWYLFILSIVIGVLVYYFVEKPIHAYTKSLLKSQIRISFK